MKINEQIKQHAINGIEGIKGTAVNACDLHHILFNTDYFIIGYAAAEKFLNSSEDGIFGAIGLIKEYEEFNFGEVTTDFSSSEKVANMYAYIKGEDLLSGCKTITKNWNVVLTDEDLDNIIKEIENL